MKNLGKFCSTHKQKITIVAALILACMAWSVIAQLLYPTSRTLPGQMINGQRVTFKSEAELAQYLTARQNESKFKLQLGDKTQVVAWQDVGVSIDQAAVAHDALSYRGAQKLIPFSGVYRVIAHDAALKTKVDSSKLQTYAQKLATENYRDPANASLTISGMTVVRHEQKPGLKYDPAKIAENIKSAPFGPNTTIRLTTTVVPAAFSESDIEQTARKTEAILATPVKVNIGGMIKLVPNTEVATWLTFSAATDRAGINVVADKAKIKTYLEGLSKSVYRAPGEMTISTQDSIETSRTADTSGQALDVDASAALLAVRVPDNKTTMIVLPITKLPPKIVYNRTYTKTSAGISALINELARGEADMAITVTALDGSGIGASANGSKQYAPASTYKLPVAYSVIKRIESGAWQWTDNINGRNVETCLSDMIVVSDNPCATAFADKIGWQTVTNEARAIGMSRTDLATNFVSTTDDQALFLSKLQQGALMNTGNQDRLLGLMKQQKYRSGIPAGANGSVVADKVGFIDGLLHDSAIVYGPKGTYAIVIYSNKSSWPRIASVAARVHAFMAN